MPLNTTVQQDAPTNSPYTVACDDDGSGHPIQLVKLMTNVDGVRQYVPTGTYGELYMAAIGPEQEGTPHSYPAVVIGGVGDNFQRSRNLLPSNTISPAWLRQNGSVVIDSQLEENELTPSIIGQGTGTIVALASNRNRRKMIIHNSPDATADMLIAFNSNPVNSSNYSVRLSPGGTYIEEGEMVIGSHVAITWEAAGTGHAAITEVTN